jgi:hypothetical protein
MAPQRRQLAVVGLHLIAPDCACFRTVLLDRVHARFLSMKPPGPGAKFEVFVVISTLHS